jgi:hypothetical protein
MRGDMKLFVLRMDLERSQPPTMSKCRETENVGFASGGYAFTSVNRSILQTPQGLMAER